MQFTCLGLINQVIQYAAKRKNADADFVCSKLAKGRESSLPMQCCIDAAADPIDREGGSVVFEYHAGTVLSTGSGEFSIGSY